MKDRIETLKEYLKRLGDGEPLEAVEKISWKYLRMLILRRS